MVALPGRMAVKSGRMIVMPSRIALQLPGRSRMMLQSGRRPVETDRMTIYCDRMIAQSGRIAVQLNKMTVSNLW